MIWRISNPSSFKACIAVLRRQCAVYFREQPAFLEISGINFENWYGLQGLARYQISVVCGEDKAALLQWLKRNVAWGSICWRKVLSVWTGQFESPVAYILLSWGASWFSSPPCQFFCLVSWERDTYSTPLSSLRKRKDLGVNCWWNSKPLDTKWRDKLNQTR